MIQGSCFANPYSIPVHTLRDGKGSFESVVLDTLTADGVVKNKDLKEVFEHGRLHSSEILYYLLTMSPLNLRLGHVISKARATGITNSVVKQFAGTKTLINYAGANNYPTTTAVLRSHISNNLSRIKSV